MWERGTPLKEYTVTPKDSGPVRTNTFVDCLQSVPKTGRTR